MKELAPKLYSGPYRDADGCIFTAQRIVLSSDNKSPLVACAHVWPFSPAVTLVAPLAGWHERFTAITRDDVQAAKDGDWDAAMARVAAQKVRLLQGDDQPQDEIPFGRYRHIDGGIYQAYGIVAVEPGKFAVLYEHLWPFERQMWARPLHEWAARFSPLPEDEWEAIPLLDQEAARLAISQSRARRKGS